MQSDFDIKIIQTYFICKLYATESMKSSSQKNSIEPEKSGFILSNKKYSLFIFYFDIICLAKYLSILETFVKNKVVLNCSETWTSHTWKINSSQGKILAASDLFFHFTLSWAHWKKYRRDVVTFASRWKTAVIQNLFLIFHCPSRRDIIFHKWTECIHNERLLSEYVWILIKS